MNMSRNAEFRILCVEDETAIRRDIVEELRDQGFAVDEAEDGAAALDAIERDAPHLIISDIQMPRMDGHQLLAALRSRKDRVADIPFVFLTAFGDRETMLAGRREGADDYLVKPVDFDLLIAAAESHLVNARRRAERNAVMFESRAVGRSLDGTAELAAALADVPTGTPLGIVAVDNLLELVSRLGGHHSDHYRGFFRALERLHGIRVFQIDPARYVVIGRPGVPLDPLLSGLSNLPLRDRKHRSAARAKLRCSVVTETLGSDVPPAEVVGKMRSAVRVLQREGGGQMVALQGPELPTLRQAGAIRSELVDAIGQGQLTVRLQPKLQCQDSRLVGAEVLVRWQSPRLGALSPATFIPVLEKAGLLHHVTDWVLRKAVECQLELVRRGLCPRLAVNIGANEFDAGLPVRLKHICAEFGTDPALLDLEITETSLMDDILTSAKVIQDLRELGVRIALDDFGTGYSSLSYLSACSIDSLKIDRSFVATLAREEANQTVIEGVIEMGRKLGIEVVAEGVETADQRAWLEQRGCGVIQGFFVSEPLMPEDYFEFALRAKNSAS